MAESTNKSAEVEIIGANQELKARVETLTRDRDQYLKWWGEINSEKSRLLNVTKSLVAYANLV